MQVSGKELEGETLELTCEEQLAIGGDALARHAGQVVFVRGAAPKDRVRARVVSSKARYLKAELVEVLEAGPSRREPPCAYFGDCGGCQLQHIEYVEQLMQKGQLVRDALGRALRGAYDGPLEMHAGPELGWRTRVRFGLDRGRVGFRRHASHEICPIETCPVLAPRLEATLQELRAIGKQPHREVELVSGDSAVTSDPSLPGHIGRIDVTVGDFTYFAAADAFFQGNQGLLESLVACVLDAAPAAADSESSAEAGRARFAVDLFCGAGLFSLPLTKRFERVVGVESDRAGFDLAVAGAKRNGSERVEFLRVDALDWVEAFAGRSGVEPPELIVLDPPRTGARELCQRLPDIEAPCIVYVSCDTQTLLRDLRPLLAGGYAIERADAFDLFPQTAHVESVVRLRKS